MNLSCYIVDDEYHSVELLARFIEATEGLELQGYATNPLTALNEVAGPNPPDITFLDVEMPELSGMEFAGLANLYTRIIITTAYREFALEAFEKEAFDFLPKPVSYPRFLRSIQRIRRLAPPEEARERTFFFVKTELKGRMVKVVIADILFIEGALNYIKIQLAGGCLMPYLTLAEIEQYLPPGRFSRIHQSFIVANDRIQAVEPGRVTLDSGHRLNLGRQYKAAFLEQMNARLLKSRRRP